MRSLVVVLLVAALVSCGDEGDSSSADSGVAGQVLLGPTCPVETKDEPCEDAPAISVDLTVHEPSTSDPMTPGDVVEQVTTEEDGTFRVDLEPGPYLITATAGLFCSTVAVTVKEDRYAKIDVPCDTGIR